MQAKHLTAVIAITALSTALAASAAQAACGNRPGTPNEVKAEPLGAATPGSATIRFSWRNTTSRAHVGKHTMYFDISVRDGKGNQVGLDKGGHGPFEVTYGSRSHQDFHRSLGALDILLQHPCAHRGRHEGLRLAEILGPGLRDDRGDSAGRGPEATRAYG